MSDVNKAFFKEESKKNWYQVCENGEKLSNDQLKLGAIMRIADATEVMSQNYVSMQRELDKFKRWYYEEVDELLKLNRRISSLKGVITKKDKKIAQLKSK